MPGFIKSVEHVLEHAATIAVGAVLTIFGLALTFSIVFALPGMIVLVGGIFSHPMLRARRAETRSTPPRTDVRS